jgi:hypothetical protein
MDVGFDVFRVLLDKSPVWIKTADSLGQAEDFIKARAVINPGEYIVFVRRTGTKLFYRAVWQNDSIVLTQRHVVERG